MLQMNDLFPNQIYRHDNRKVYARLVRWLGDSESGGAATVEIAGQETVLGLNAFMRKYNVVDVRELADDAYKNQG